MKGFLPAAALVLLLLQAAPAAEPAMEPLPVDTSYFLPLSSVDIRAMLPPPPAPGSPEARVDIDAMLQIQAMRSPAHTTQAQNAAGDTLAKFSDVLGSWFDLYRLPQTDRLLSRAFSDGYEIFLEANALYRRDRPSNADPRVRPSMTVPATNSYPSAHAWQAWFRAGMLAEIFPEWRMELEDRARSHAWLRVVAGLHYPSDVTASRTVANATIAEMMKNPAMRTAIRAARAEAESQIGRKR